MSQLFDRSSHPDRPWRGRGYGRIRLDESLARDLVGILSDEVERRLELLHAAREAGEDITAIKGAVKRAATIRERSLNLLKEQGWEDG